MTGELLDRHRVPLYRYAFLLCGVAEEAEDLVQEAFARVLAAGAELASMQAPVAYLRRSVTNLFLERGRRASLWNKRLPTLWTGGSIRDPAEDAAIRDQVRVGLRRLSDRQRAAIVLRYYVDLDYDEIGKLLDCPATTARSLAARALGRMRISLSAEDEEANRDHDR